MDEKMSETLKGMYENLTDEQKKKVKECKDMEELMKLAGEWGIELPDDLVENVAGGCGSIDWRKLAEQALEIGEVL